ncbi:MAG: hypothetical protein ACMUIM_07390 [bacterium]
MRKSSRFHNLFLIIIAVTMLLCLTGVARAFHDIWHPDVLTSQPLIVPTINSSTGDILIDNFEYWDSPYNHGWRQIEPSYPVYGFGLGYATIFNTVLDLQEGSRVLDVYRSSSIFLLGTPYEKHGILYNLFTPPAQGETSVTDYIDLSKNPVVSFKIRAPLGIEPWDIFEVDVIGLTEAGHNITVRIRPIQPSAGAYSSDVSTSDGMYALVSNVTNFVDGSSIEVTVNIGRGFLDGSWHVIWIDLTDVVKTSVDGFGDISTIDRPDWYMTQADVVFVSGQIFRLDDISFRSAETHELLDHLDYPDLFELGPLYAQIFEPYRYLFISDYSGVGHPGTSVTEDRIIDLMLDLDNFTTDPNLIIDTWLQDSNVGGVIQMDPNYLDPNHSSYGNPEPYYSNLLGRDFVIDINLPVFSDPNVRIGGSLGEDARKSGTLGWNATIGGYGANGIQSFILEPLPVNPYDGMPTYLPAYYVALEAVQVFGKPYFPPQVVFILESALWNSGVVFWPNIAALDYTPQYFEDLIVTIEVTNGVHSDVRTFPISVVNYPVENYPPVLQLDIDDQIFYVGETHEYIMVFIDPDCFIFSLAQFLGREPATTHVPGFPLSANFRTDMDSLTWNITINGLPSYQYGPWIEQIINPCNGVITWIPKFEGAYDAAVTCSDARGGTGFGEITIFAVNRGTWLNHPPIILGGPTQPVVIRAGEEFNLHAPNFAVEDPDGDQIYASCNIGSCGRLPDDSFLWSFQSNFPGSYLIEIIFYDIRGGYAIMEFFLEVKPWWSY